MTIVTDPDNLDRWQVLVSPVAKTISIRGLDTERVAPRTTGSGAGSTTFTDTNPGIDFGASGVVAGDILTIFSDPENNGGIDGGVIGHYKVSSAGTTTLVVDRAIDNTPSGTLDYKINLPMGQGSGTPVVSDGVTMQCLYSFLKEEWRTKSGPANGEDLIRYTFPIVSITSEQFEIGGPSNSWWDFADNSGDGVDADESPRNLIRTGGWASVNEAGEVINNYPSIVTLGSLDSDAQVYYQLTSSTTVPVDFVLTGAVNQAIETLSVTSGVTGEKIPVGQITTDLNFSTSGVTKTGADFTASGYAVGDAIQVRGAEDSDNNGIFEISAIENSNQTVVITGSTLVSNADDDTAVLSPVTDNRDYLVLRVRKKAKSYAQSEIADIGVSQVNTIVNRFPLAHIDDPAIVLDDGAINGDGTTGDGGNDAFQSVTQINTGTEGTLVDNGDGTFDLSNTTDPDWDGANQLYAGDTVEITGPASNPNIGVYEVSSVEDTDTVVLIAEPGRTVDVAFGAGSGEWTARSRVRDAGTASGVAVDDATAGQGLFSDSNANFSSVVAGDILRIKSGTYEGVYPVISTGVASTGIIVNTLQSNSADADIPEDQEFSATAETDISYDILQAGMHLQYKKSDGTSVVSGGTYSGATITDAGFTTGNGYYVGSVITITGTTNNNGTYVITDLSGTQITCDNTDGTAASFNGADDGTGTIAVTHGFVRKLGVDNFSFNWKLLGNGGTLAECFQFLQKQLRLTTDIDEGVGTSRGDITDLLMTFASPNGTTLNLFIDNVDPGEKNNLTQQDLTGTSRNFPFLVTLRIALNSNITGSTQNKIVVFFSDSDGTPGNDDEFGTPGAVIVSDSTGADMVATEQTVTPLDFEYDYTAGGASDRAITIVAISDTNGQYVSTTSTLTRDNVVNASLVAGLERNYSNP